MVHDGRDSLIGLIVVIECHNSTQVILNSSIRAEVFRDFIMIKFRTYGRGEATSFDTHDNSYTTVVMKYI